MKSQTIRRVLAVAVVLMAFSGGDAWAQKKASFDAIAQGAVVVGTPGQLGAAFWALFASCDKSSSDLARRQCEGVKAARSAKVKGRVYAVRGDANAFTVGAYDEAKMSVSLTVNGCVSCAKPVSVLGKDAYLTSRGEATVSGGAVTGAKLHSSTKTFKTAKAADAWLASTAPRLRTEFLIKVADGGGEWKKGGVVGYGVEVVGYRVYDPCDGAIVCASPDSSGGTVDKRACSGEVVAEDTAPVEDKKPVEPAKPTLPSKLSAASMQRSLQPARDAAQECYMTYGVSGTAKVRISFDNEGTVTEVQQTGDFEDTPTGDCVVKGVKAVKFEPTTRKSTTVTFPFVLR